MKKLTSLALAFVMAICTVITAATPVTVEAKTKKGKVQNGIYVASFDSSKTNYVKSVKFDKKGNLIVKANFKFGTEDWVDKNDHSAGTTGGTNGTGLIWKSTGMKTFKFKQLENGDGVDGGADFYLHNYKNGKKNPKFYHYTEEEFIKSVNKRYGTSWRLVITTCGGEDAGYAMTSAAIVKYSGKMTNYVDTARYGYNERVTQDELSWADLHYAWDGSVIGWGPEAEKLGRKGTYDGELIR